MKIDYEYYEQEENGNENAGGLGQFTTSTSWYLTTMERIIADQKARLGRFLTWQQTLLGLADRARTIGSVNASRGNVLLTRINTLLQKQKTLETQGMELVSKIGTLQQNPIIMAVTGNPDFIKAASTELELRIDVLWKQIKDLWSVSTSLNVQVDTQEDEINTLKKDVIRAENEILGKGIIPSVTKILDKPLEIVKWVAVAGIGIFALTLVIKRK